MIGKNKRLKRIFNESGNIILTPLDHGITLGPISGIANMNRALTELIENEVDTVILHKGIIEKNYNILSSKKLGLVMHLSASTNLSAYSNYKINVATVEEAIKMGCDGVSVHINLGNDKEHIMLESLAKFSRDCNNNGMPLIAMMYARGNAIENESDIRYVKHIARVAAELGADVVKVNYTGNSEEFSEVVQGCGIPVIIAGGEKRNEIDILKMTGDAMSAGARGVSIGRNVFQSSKKPLLIKALKQLVHDRKNIDDVIEEYIELDSKIYKCDEKLNFYK